MEIKCVSMEGQGLKTRLSSGQDVLADSNTQYGGRAGPRRMNS